MPDIPMKKSKKKLFYWRRNIPAEQQPMTRPRRCGGVLVILIRIKASAEPIMNVRRIFTGMNHLHIEAKSHLYIQR